MKKRRLVLVLLAALLRDAALFAQEASIPPLWRQALGASVLGRPAAQAESVVMVCDGGTLKSYSRRGTFLWSYAAGGRLGSHISRSREGTSYVCGTNGVFAAVNRSGRELWRVRLPAPLSAPALSGWDGRLFVPLGESLRCYTAAAYLLWSHDFESPISFGPLPDNRGGVILGLEQQDGVFPVYNITHSGGLSVYSLDEKPIRAVPLELITGGAKQSGLAFVFQSGKVEWRGSGETVTLARLPSPPLDAVSRGTRLALVLADGSVRLLDGETKSELWTGESHLESGSAEKDLSMLYDERGVYVISPSGASGFAEDGRRLWLLRLKGASSCPAFGDEGILYSGGSDWILYAYRLEERVLRTAQSLYGPIPEGSYGLGDPPPSGLGGPAQDSALRDYFLGQEDLVRELLTMIEDHIRKGEVGLNEAEYTAFLMEIGGSASGASVQSPVQTVFRAEALRLLSFIGSRETIPFLVKVFVRDRDTSVKAAAAAAIGRIGVDPDGLALSAFAKLSFPPGLARDDYLLLSMAAAIGSLCRFSGPPLSDAGIKLLMSLGRDDMPFVVRNRVRDEIASLR
ncbi:MAG: PQQ-binding-like beta-propeller repeat protein [Spirochaetaceae bacterium]|nr:PQQ-binding-like beta-propeller repeat protein [Spirochaetaceae bacterium]